MKTLYTEPTWVAFCNKIESDYRIKSYPHFDPLFNFARDKNKIHEIISDTTHQRVAQHDFLPFVKILQKTPRYKWQNDEQHPDGGEYDLESKIRPISFASHFDTYIYSYYAFALNEIYQDYIKHKGFDEVVLAYRNDLGGKCNIQFAKEAFDEVKNRFNTDGSCAVIALDIKGYFDNIQHNKLKEMWLRVINETELPPDQYHVFRSLTKYAYINLTSFQKQFDINFGKIKRKQNKKLKRGEHQVYQFNSLLDLIPDKLGVRNFKEKMNILRERGIVSQNSEFDSHRKRVLKKSGIPQGSAMSAVLSNIYLADFDQEIYEKGIGEGFVYRRYCDDLLIICHPAKVNELKDFLMNKIKNDCFLTIQDKKTEVIDFKPNEHGIIRSFRRKYDEIKSEFIESTVENKNYKNLQYLGFEFNGQNYYIRPASLSRFFRKMKARIVKTIGMAYGKNSKAKVIFKKQLFERYSHVGERNFIRYAHNAASEHYENSKKEKKPGFNSPSIRKQISAHMHILNQEIEKTSGQQAAKKGISTILK